MDWMSVVSHLKNILSDNNNIYMNTVTLCTICRRRCRRVKAPFSRRPCDYDLLI